MSPALSHIARVEYSTSRPLAAPPTATATADILIKLIKLDFVSHLSSLVLIEMVLDRLYTTRPALSHHYFRPDTRP